MSERRIVGGSRTAHEWTEPQRRLIQAELERIVVHPSFKGSRRSIDLLRHLVDQALSGEEEGVKERTLGIEVFGRDPSYDTNADPIVRRTANEIRKRLALSYLESQQRPPVQIHLERGSYRAIFEFVDDQAGGSHFKQAEPEAWREHEEPRTVQILESLPLPTPDTHSRRIWLLVGTGAVVLALFAWFLLARSTHSTERNLWNPLVTATPEVTICLPDLKSFIDADHVHAAATKGATSEGSEGLSRFSSDTPFSDVNVAHAVSSRLSSLYKLQTQLKPCSTLKLQDFKQNSTVLIGGTNNPWVLLLLSKISGARYSIQTDAATREIWIRDSTKPDDRSWKSDGQPHDEGVSTDYGLITRFVDQESGQWVLALSGLGAHGTEAAGLVADNPQFTGLLPADLRSTGNIQVVVQASVVRGATGSIKVVSSYRW